VRPTLTIIAGANGSGKSSFSAVNIKNVNIRVLDADLIAKEANITNISAGKKLIEEAYNLINNRSSFAIETTLSGKFIFKIIKTARNKGYHIELIYVYLSNWRLNRERINNRVKLGGHDIPSQDIIRRLIRSIDNVPLVIKLVDDWRIYKNSSCYNLILNKQDNDVEDVKLLLGESLPKNTWT